MARPMRTAAIIPCFNEERAVAGVVAELRAFDPAIVTVVVDDGSSDATARVARETSLVIRLPVNLGIGGAVQTGIRYAARHDFDACIQVDGDAQHVAGEIAALLKVRAETGASLVIGSRFIGEGSFRSTAMRRVGIGLIASTLATLFGVRVTDPTSGFRLMDRRAIALFAEHYPQDFPEPVSIAVAVEHGLSVAEAPVSMRERVHGTSSLAGLRSAAYMFRVIGYLVLVRLKRFL
ncbi:MAG: glycosyltransferase family 2 protein [Lysobacter sp.]|nr:glycosyltransferase family 2 protein [Lysobacter sp.]